MSWPPLHSQFDWWPRLRHGRPRIDAMPRVKLGDIRAYYEVKGEGFPLLMINGMYENLDCWDPRLIDGLSGRFKLVLLDNRGAGRTDVSDREYTIRLLADDAAHLLDALHIAKAHVLGLSMGGAVAQELAINHPTRVSKLVLCATTSRWVMRPEVSKILEAMERGCSQEELVEMYLAIPFVKEYPIDLIRKDPSIVNLWTAGFVKDHLDHVLRWHQRFGEHLPPHMGASRQLRAMRKFNSRGRLMRIGAPTLVLHGRRDFAIPLDNGRVLAEGIPGAKLVVLKDSAHYLAEDMDQVVKLVREFLQ